MSAFFHGRYAAQTDEPFVVFLIGMTINKPLAVRQWAPILRAMMRMVGELNAQPDLGMLGSKYYASPSAFLLVQYWRSFEDLEHFARSADELHLPAWKDYNQRVARTDAVGVFHETYLVEPESYEAVYVNMPRFGLGLAVDHVPAKGRYLTARRRLGSRGENEAAVEAVH